MADGWGGAWAPGIWGAAWGYEAAQDWNSFGSSWAVGAWDGAWGPEQEAAAIAAEATGGWISDPYRRQSRIRDEEVRRERIRLGIIADDASEAVDEPREAASKAPVGLRKRTNGATAPILSDGEITRLIAVLEDDAARQRRRRIAAILLLAACGCSETCKRRLHSTG